MPMNGTKIISSTYTTTQPQTTIPTTQQETTTAKAFKVGTMVPKTVSCYYAHVVSPTNVVAPLCSTSSPQSPPCGPSATASTTPRRDGCYQKERDTVMVAAKVADHRQSNRVKAANRVCTRVAEPSIMFVCIAADWVHVSLNISPTNVPVHPSTSQFNWRPPASICHHPPPPILAHHRPPQKTIIVIFLPYSRRFSPPKGSEDVLPQPKGIKAARKGLKTILNYESRWF